MNKKLKLTSAILSASLLITPISGIINKNDNLAKAEELKKESNNIQKHIEYIDTQIYLENNNLKINKNNILNYIQKNWNEINVNNQFQSPEDFYNKIQNSVNDLNKQVNSGWRYHGNCKLKVFWASGYFTTDKLW